MASEEQLQVDLADRITKLDQLRREQRTYGQARKAIKELVESERDAARSSLIG